MRVVPFSNTSNNLIVFPVFANSNRISDAISRINNVALALLTLRQQ